MHLNKSGATYHVPDGKDFHEALARTTDICIAAHQDDIEIMAFAPTIECFGKPDRHFTGVTVTDGAGSPRSGIYADYTNEQMQVVRQQEQDLAADVGGYAAQLQLYYSSKEVKDAKNEELVNELANILKMAAPETVYTHNLADKHDTHVAVALRTIAAIRKLPMDARPKRLIALEVWRGLDWLCDEQKVVLDTSKHQNLAAALLGVYDSQIAGGKRYDLAAMGRRTANATFFASHNVDDTDSCSYGLDMTQLITDDTIDPVDFITGYIDSFRNEISTRIGNFS